MNGNKITIWIYYGVVLLTLLFNSYASANVTRQVVIVPGSDNSYFNQTIKTLLELKADSIDFKIILSDKLRSQMKVSDLKNSLFITLGYRATKLVTDLFPGQPIISAYSTKEQIEKLSPPPQNQLAVLLDQPLERYLAFSRYLVGSRNPGIVNETAIKLTRRQKDFLKRLDLNLSQYQPDKTEDLLATIRHLKQQSDALIMLPNQRLYNRDTLKGVLLTAYRNRIPIISYSPAHVKSGALASIYSSPDDIGRQLSELLSNSISTLQKAGQTLHYARYYSIKINRRVAHSQGFKLPKEAEIRRLLSKALP